MNAEGIKEMSVINSIAGKPLFYKMTREASKMENLLNFFSAKYNLDILQEFTSKDIKQEKKRDKMSLRLIDWFVINYAKQHGIIYDIKRLTGRVDKFFVWMEYQSALDSEGKEHFDPFRRGKNEGKIIELEYAAGQTLKTTLAQLNFFKWAIKNGVIDYVRNHTEEIYNDMCTRGSAADTTDKGAKKRKLSVSVSKTLGMHNVTMAVSFKKA